MKFGSLVAIIAAALAACASDPHLDRANEDFVVTITDAELSVGESLGIGFHPTEGESVIHAEGVRGPLVICPVDSAGVLMPNATLDVPPCDEVVEVTQLERTDGQLHAAVGFRAFDQAGAETLTLRYRQADGYFALFYAGEPQTVTLAGPAEARPLVTNFGDEAVRINGIRLGPAEAVEVSDSSLAVSLGSEASLDIDWFRERAQSEPG